MSSGIKPSSAVEGFERLARPAEFEQRDAAPIDKSQIFRSEPQSFVEADQRPLELPERVEDQPQAREPVGAGNVAFQRLLEECKRRIEPAAPVVELAKAVQGVEAVRAGL